MKNKSRINRKDFLKTLGLAGLGAALPLGVACKREGNTESQSGANLKPTQVPKNTLGKTGLGISTLMHGIMYNLVENQTVLYKALEWGVNTWDTSHGYAGGNSELGIGKFLKKNPEKRKDIVIVSKASGAWSSEEVEKRLQLSLKRMNTSYIDIYYGAHGLSDPAALTPELRKWADSAKKRKLIKYFGFSTHKNMAKCLMAASKIDWIDVIMPSYNFRLMQDKQMQDGVEACHQKGIGLIAMKLLALKVETDGDQNLVRHFIKKGFTDAQAKIKTVLDDKRISAVCISMASNALIATNAAAILDKRLSSGDRNVLRKYALNTCSSYCAGCAVHCDRALPDMPYVSDVMRYLMYYNNYGEEKKARKLFSEIPAIARHKFLETDYTLAEKFCPQRLPIASLMREAMNKLA